LVLAVVFGAIVGAIGIALVAFTSDDDNGDDVATDRSTTSTSSGGGPTSSSPPTTVSPDDLSPAAKEFLALAEKGSETSFHARYQAEPTPNAPPQQGPYSLVLELWNAPPNTRRDVSLNAQNSTILTQEFQFVDKVVRCGKPNAEASWSCVALAPGSGPQEPGTPGFGLAPGVLAGRKVAVGQRDIDGQQAKCFAVDAQSGGPADELCMSSEGIPLEFTSGGSLLKLVLLERSVDDADAVFEPPATPIGG
jgi:hypothetical protein